MSHATIRSGTGAFGRFLRLWVLGFCLLSATHVYADTVTPTIDVSTGVVVRASASAQSAAIATLLPGRELELVGSVPYWHEVRLPNGSTGFVSKRWTRVIPTGVPPVGPPPPTAPTFTIDVVDVGTGLAVLVRGPDFALVYDAGSNDDLARGPNNRRLAFIQTAAPTLTTIDHMILSHPHRDHLELLPDLLATYSVRQVWDSGRINDICGYRAFLTAIRDEPGVQYHNALQDFGTRDYPFAAKVNGCYGQAAPAVTVTLTHASRINSEDPIPLGQDASMRILHADGANHPNANENTLVVRLDLGTTRILLVGDAPGGPRANPATPPTVGSIEQVLVTCCANALAQILVVGHHGSNDLVSGGVPRCDRVVDCGCLLRANAYGSVTLPDQSIVTELQSRGQVFRTDVNDAACATNPNKIGPDSDGEPGGCTNIRIVLKDSVLPQVSVWNLGREGRGLCVSGEMVKPDEGSLTPCHRKLKIQDRYFHFLGKDS